MSPCAEELRRSKHSIMKVNRQRRPDGCRRHRKPLSCTPCRTRKIKCDRAKPCNQCVRSRTVDACDYEPSTPTLPLPPPSTTRQPTPPSYIFSSSRTPTHCSASAGPDANLRLPRPRGWPTFDRINSSLPGDHGSLPHASGYQSLATWGVSKLGQGYPSELPLANPQQNNVYSFRGKHNQTRFFGRSHWNATFQMVSLPKLVIPIHQTHLFFSSVSRLCRP